MAHDHKYGHVQLEHGTIGEDEPVIVFRARDARILDMLACYAKICIQAGSPRRHLDMILDSYSEIATWQDEHLDEVKIPDSETSREWMP